MFSRFSRRQIISLIGFTIAGAAASSVPFLSNLFNSKAQAQAIGRYKDRTYRIIHTSPTFRLFRRSLAGDNTFDSSTQLFVDEQEIRIIQHNRTKKFITPTLFGEFDDPKDIAETVIDLNLQFPNGTVELDPYID
jgi:hypothetical protein